LITVPFRTEKYDGPGATRGIAVVGVSLSLRCFLLLCHFFRFRTTYGQLSPCPLIIAASLSLLWNHVEYGSFFLRRAVPLFWLTSTSVAQVLLAHCCVLRRSDASVLKSTASTSAFFGVVSPVGEESDQLYSFLFLFFANTVLVCQSSTLLLGEVTPYLS